MKLKKHNYASTAAIVLYCFTSYKSFFYKRFTVLLVVITSLFSSYIYSQQPTISGLENIHISEGATIIEKKSNKAMILPKVASPHLNIKNPAPGMIVYDTDARQLAVFNGTVWSFWKP